MGEAFGKFVAKWMTDNGKYVAVGSRCSICRRRLGFFATGLWSTNAHHLSDGPICTPCHDTLQALIHQKEEWMPSRLRRTLPWKQYTKTTWRKMTVEEANALIRLKEQNDKQRLAAYGKDTVALFRVQETFRIAPTAYEVGIQRSKKMQNALVAYGVVDEGEFAGKEALRIDRGGEMISAAALEIYEDDNVNPFDMHLHAAGGKQKLSEGKSGWIILDTQEEVSIGDPHPSGPPYIFLENGTQTVKMQFDTIPRKI